MMEMKVFNFVGFGSPDKCVNQDMWNTCYAAQVYVVTGFNSLYGFVGADEMDIFHADRLFLGYNSASKIAFFCYFCSLWRIKRRN